jgi:hypothetical protein
MTTLTPRTEWHHLQMNVRKQLGATLATARRR